MVTLYNQLSIKTQSIFEEKGKRFNLLILLRSETDHILHSIVTDGYSIYKSIYIVRDFQ